MVVEDGGVTNFKLGS